MKLSLLKTFILSLLLFAQTAFSAEKVVTLDIQNMTCAFCPITVKKSLKGVEGVGEVKVSFDDKTAIVHYEDSQATPKQLISATTSAGYPSTVKADSAKK